MNPRVLLLLLPLLAGVSVWLVQSAGDPTAPDKTDAPAAVAGAVATIATEATAVDGHEP
jgi:hypothetical protein